MATMKVPANSQRNKLKHLSISQPSIETVAGFCVFYHKDAAGVVSVWNEEFAKAPNDRRLALLYLANHVLQEGRKKGSAYPTAFMGVLPRAMARLASSGDEQSQRAVTRLVSVWEERRVFGSTQLAALREAVGGGAAAAGGDDQPAAARGGTKPSSNKKAAGAGGGKGSNGAARSGGSSSSGAAAARLGPVGDALTAALDAAAEAAACGRAFTASWAQVCYMFYYLQAVCKKRLHLSGRSVLCPVPTLCPVPGKDGCVCYTAALLQLLSCL